MKIAMIPIDNRPVCYTLAQQIASIDKSLELLLPDRTLLGGLRSVADIEGIFNWLDSLGQVDALVVSLDTIAYGGLISSRRSKDSLDEIKSRLYSFKEKLENQVNVKGKIYAFSSIMRISNNNVNEEEKEYWNEYGTKIFEYSQKFHKEGIETDDVPKEVLTDYLATRHRNFSINKIYLDWIEEGFFNTLVFSKDDCAEFGLNVLEAQILRRLIAEKKTSENDSYALIKTGADEIPLTLFARAVCDYNRKVNFRQAPKISAKFLAPESKDLISNYEDISIEKCVKAQIELGSKCDINDINEQDADIILIVNNFVENQGEIVMDVKTQPFMGKLDIPKKPYMIADVRYANGSDNEFVKKLFAKKIDFRNFYGYSAWNTSANTLGSLICAAVVRFFAKNYNETAFKELQMIRFLDDWAYQANVRQFLKGKGKKEKGKEARPDFRELKPLMYLYEKKLIKVLSFKPHEIKYKFPWKRFFEVEVIVK